MAKNDRKKKSSVKKNSTQIEQERRRRLNEWRDLLRRVCVSCGAGALFDTLTDWERNYFETTRFPPFQLRKAPGHDVPKEIYDWLESMLKKTEATTMVTIPGGLRLPVGDFIRAVFCLRAFHWHCTQSPKSRFAQWIAFLDPLLEFERSAEKGFPPMLGLFSQMCYFAALAGDLDRQIYPVNKVHDRRDNLGTMLNYFEISTIEAQHRTFSVGKERRRSYRLFFQSVYSMKVTPGELSTSLIPGMQDQPERLLPVYVQEHVRQRMIERLAPFDECEMDHLLGDTMRRPTVFPGRAGSFLISLDMYSCRLGYVVAEVIDEAVLMRTFLFVTQSGTPEGNRLNERLRVGKYEKTYFEIDRLGAFLTTDLCQHPAFREILIECGIGDLIEVVNINREIRFSLKTRAGYAEKLHHWLDLGSLQENAAPTPPQEPVATAIVGAAEPPLPASSSSPGVRLPGPRRRLRLPLFGHRVRALSLVDIPQE